MTLYSWIRTRVLSWSQDTPLPKAEPDVIPSFQSWHAFDPFSNSWSQIGLGSTPGSAPAIATRRTDGTSNEPERGSTGLVLVTWNVDYSSKDPEARMTAILTHIQHSETAADLIFFQEVSHPALITILRNPWVREGWYSSEADTTNWGQQSFATMLLISRSRFSHVRGVPGQATLGAVWRVKYPSRDERDALCCDILLPSPSPASQAPSLAATDSTRVRLINVHLNSLPLQPSDRPRQLSIVTSMLRAAGRGLVAGDFNPVLPTDETLLRDNRLVDVWTDLHPDEPGFTWGIEGEKPFPPTRLDKVGMLGLRAQSIEVMLCAHVPHSGSPRRRQETEDTAAPSKERVRDEMIPWSDHAGLNCSFTM